VKVDHCHVKRAEDLWTAIQFGAHRDCIVTAQLYERDEDGSGDDSNR
jgi:hypothetical protein